MFVNGLLWFLKIAAVLLLLWIVIVVPLGFREYLRRRKAEREMNDPEATAALRFVKQRIEEYEVKMQDNLSRVFRPDKGKQDPNR